MSNGKVIMLQGASSAGKSTLARALQQSLEEFWWVFEADDVTRMMRTWENGKVRPDPTGKTHPSWQEKPQLNQWLAGYWQCIATISKTGSNVITGGGWLETEWLFQLAQAVEGLEAYCVGVYCPLEELERRERQRGDRGIGYARSQYDVVHLHAPHDAEVDTLAQSTEQCIDAIGAMLEAPPDVTFFTRIRSSQAYRDWESVRNGSTHA